MTFNLLDGNILIIHDPFRINDMISKRYPGLNLRGICPLIRSKK